MRPMVFAAMRFPHMPVVLVTIDLPLDAYLPSLRSLNLQLSRIAATAQEPLHVLIDLRDRPLSFSDVLLWIDVYEKTAPWMFSPHVRPGVIGTHPMIPVFVRHILEQSGITLQQFATLDEAQARILANHES